MKLVPTSLQFPFENPKSASKNSKCGWETQEVAPNRSSFFVGTLNTQSSFYRSLCSPLDSRIYPLYIHDMYIYIYIHYKTTINPLWTISAAPCYWTWTSWCCQRCCPPRPSRAEPYWSTWTWHGKNAQCYNTIWYNIKDSISKTLHYITLHDMTLHEIAWH